VVQIEALLLEAFHEFGYRCDRLPPVSLLGMARCLTGFETVVAISDPVHFNCWRQTIGCDFGSISERISFALNY
jgi:hypothetical protein